MDFTEEFDLGHLVLQERKCRVCGKVKDLLTDFYKTHKDRGNLASSYSYECKMCTIKRVLTKRKKDAGKWVYPDW